MCSTVTLFGSMLLATVGCSPEADTEPTHEELTAVEKPLTVHPAEMLYIYFSDPRPSSNVTVTVRDNWGRYSASATEYNGPIPGSSTPQSGRMTSVMYWNTNHTLTEMLYMHFGGVPYSDVEIYNQIPLLDTSITVTVRATINGYCHEDYETTMWEGDTVLYFNGNGASYDGSCFRGNMLRTTP
jgi:hypothetical protein